MIITRCPCCLKDGHAGFCGPCRKRLFNGKPVSPVLGFSRPEYNQRRLEHSDRISISGVQSKYSLVLRGASLELAETGGEYILKPFVPGEFENMEEMPANEHLTMQVAGRVFKLNTAECALVFFSGDNSPAFLTKRFDVLPDGARVLQEDFAQIADMSEDTHGRNYKYDSSYENIANLMKKHVSAYAVEAEKFFRLVTFNYLVHNGDAHLKNFSLQYSPVLRSYILSPAYDLLNTRLHLLHESALALELFASDYQTESFAVNGFYAYDDFFEFGVRIGIPPARTSRFLEGIHGKEEEMIRMIDSSFLSGPMKSRYIMLLQDRFKALGYSHSKNASA